MLPALTALIALVCILLMGAVLVQNPKGGGVDATFGGGASNQIFGAAKSTDFMTWGLFALMLILCIIAALVAGGLEGNSGIILESAE